MHKAKKKKNLKSPLLRLPDARRTFRIQAMQRILIKLQIKPYIKIKAYRAGYVNIPINFNKIELSIFPWVLSARIKKLNLKPIFEVIAIANLISSLFSDSERCLKEVGLKNWDNGPKRQWIF